MTDDTDDVPRWMLIVSVIAAALLTVLRSPGKGSGTIDADGDD
ncbi:hypothetical protein AB0K09_16915 [Streptomyces sp. NPDC049577]